MSRPHFRDPKLEQFWRVTIAKWIQSRLNIRDFCRQHRLGESAFYFWRREIAHRDGAPVAASASRPKIPATCRSSARATPPHRAPTLTPRPSFVALRVVPDTPLELVLRTGQVLRVPPGYDADHLRVVVAALEASPC